MTKKKLALWTLGLLAIYCIASILMALIPNQRVITQLSSAAKSHSISPLDYTKGYFGDEIDHYSECIALTQGLGRTKWSSDLVKGFADPDLGPCDTSMSLFEGRVVSVHAISNHAAYQNYFRYWNGYVVVTKPLLSIFGLRWARFIMLGLTGLSVLGLFGLIWARLSWFVALALALPLLTTVDMWDIYQSLPHAISTTVAFSMGALIFHILSKNSKKSSYSRSPLRYLGLSALAGSIFNFVDLMTNPPLAWMLTVACTLLGVVAYWKSNQVTEGNLAAGHLARVSGWASLGWLGGYSLTWVSKWIIDLLLFGWHEFVSQVFDEITFRSGGSTTSVQAISINLRFWVGPFHHRTLIAALLLLASITLIIWSAKTGGVKRAITLVVALGWYFIFSFVWYALVREQSYIQAFFTYRSLGMSLGVVFGATATSALIVATSQNNPNVLTT